MKPRPSWPRSYRSTSSAKPPLTSTQGSWSSRRSCRRPPAARSGGRSCEADDRVDLDLSPSRQGDDADRYSRGRVLGEERGVDLTDCGERGEVSHVDGETHGIGQRG